MFCLEPVVRKSASGLPTNSNTKPNCKLATCKRLIFPIWKQEETNLESSEQLMRKLICPLMFYYSYDATHFLRISNVFLGRIRVAIGIILGL